VVISFWSSAGEDLEKARGRCVETAFLSADESVCGREGNVQLHVKETFSLLYIKTYSKDVISKLTYTFC